ncbi:membrane protein [Paenibacillus sp. FSL H7-0357]|uniref:M23 family metallopeptidase n=1 Tax=Paenibacillus sp. FSL H7-0357 TaxID=1536774 RepID=UPI0004F87D6D|nr:M23 family metallopeptidase [Paenibacillus sp. FSL H7-0357]AIQ21353.1 membrane protein [Paenibacillus sp. FSL H7-0357]
MKGFKFMRGMGKLRDKAETSAEFSAESQKGSCASSETNVFYQETKPRRFRRSWIAASAGLVLLATFSIGVEKKYVTANTVTYYKVLVKGEEIGKISEETELDRLFEEKQQEYQLKYPDSVMVLQTSGITTEAEKAYKPEIDSAATLDKLDGMLKAYAVGVQLTVDGKAVGIVKDQETANAVLQSVKEHYVPVAAVSTGTQLKRTAATRSAKAAAPANADKVESVAIQEDVAVVPVKADPTQVLSVEEAVEVLTEGKEEPLVYAVQEGDTVSGIAKRFEITQADIFRNNPSVKELTLQIGDELQLTVPQPELTVVTVEQVSEQLVTEPEVIVRKSDELAAGKSKVVRAGQTGLKQMQYRVTKENGLVVKEEWMGQTVLKASLPEVVYRGTKVVGEGTGMFAWPVSRASLSSSFGQRWGRSHKGVDLVSGNRTITAADAGTVTFAGVQSGYGNVVIVDHKNGYVTYYGHLRSISVSVGQRLEQGAGIGVMGNTGRSTGTHLHFEIRKNGTAVNPLRYLK